MSANKNPEAIAIEHGGTRLALFPWRDAEGPPLLLLHALYEDATALRDLADCWSGPVFGIDLSGHGRSAWRDGGVYSPELFAADADAALAEIARESDEPVVVAGEGIGAYASLLLAGGRPEWVRAGLLAAGRGLGSGDAMPDPERSVADFERNFLAPCRAAGTAHPGGVDPRVAMAEFDPRPPDYAKSYALRAKHILRVGNGAQGPPWWQALGEVSTVETVPGPLGRALEAWAQA